MPLARRARARTLLASRAGAARVALSRSPRRLLRAFRALRESGRPIPKMESQDLTQIDHDRSNNSRQE